jgi:hypothetical protein
MRAHEDSPMRLGTVIELGQGGIKVKWDSGRTSYYPIALTMGNVPLNNESCPATERLSPMTEPRTTEHCVPTNKFTLRELRVGKRVVAKSTTAAAVRDENCLFLNWSLPGDRQKSED